MSITDITQVAGFNQSMYNEIINESKAKNVNQAIIDKSLLEHINSGKDFDSAIIMVKKDLPNLAQPKSTSSDLTAVASFGAAVFGLLNQVSSEQRKVNRDNVQATGDAAIKGIQDEAKEIRRNAVTQLVMGIIGGAISIASGMGSCAIAMGVGKMGRGDSLLVAARVNGFSTAVGGAGQMIQASAAYENSLSQAKQKDFQAATEIARNSREMIKSFTDSLNEFISKTLKSQEDIMAGQNQTRQKILG